MRLYYENKCNQIGRELIGEFTTPEEVAECILSFLEECQFEVYYFRIIDYREKNDTLIIDFGSHYQFYYVEDCRHILSEFANRMEDYRRQRGSQRGQVP